MLTYIFVLVEVETLESVNAEGLHSLDQIGDRLSAITGNPRESSLYQRLSVLIQWLNMIAFHGSFISETDIEA